MSENEPSSTELLFLLTILLSGDYEDDPIYLEDAYNRIERRLRRTQHWDPMLDELFRRAVRRRRSGGSRASLIARESAISVVEGFSAHFSAEQASRFEKIGRQFAELKEESTKLGRNLAEAKKSMVALASDFRDVVWCASLGINPANVRTVRYVPARVFVGDPVPNEIVLETLCKEVELLAGRADLVVASELPAEQGSWWKRFIFRTKEAATHKEVVQRAKKVERGLEVQYLDKPQSEANRIQAEAVASLLGSLDNVPQACIQVGTLLVVKAVGSDGKICVAARTLSIQELERIEIDQSILSKPDEILAWLAVRADNNKD